MSTHTIQTKIEVHFTSESERETAHPTVEITYNYSRGSPAFTPRGKYGPIDPPEPPALAFRTAKYIARDGLDEDPTRLQDWAEEWLYGPGYDYACDCAELDLAAQKHAHLAARAIERRTRLSRKYLSDTPPAWREAVTNRRRYSNG